MKRRARDDPLHSYQTLTLYQLTGRAFFAYNRFTRAVMDAQPLGGLPVLLVGPMPLGPTFLLLEDVLTGDAEDGER